AFAPLDLSKYAVATSRPTGNFPYQLSDLPNLTLNAGCWPLASSRSFQERRIFELEAVSKPIFSLTPLEREALTKRKCNMLWTIFIILLVCWALGMVTSTTMGGFIHILLVVAVVVVLIRIIQGRQPI